ncbi:hypothetical protein BG003_011467 [Podila horticola]|nr:hypothetical protein BG003_011467 [Podila horticola]
MNRPQAQHEHWRDNRGPPPPHHNDQAMTHPPRGRNPASVSNIFDYAKNMHWDQTRDHHAGPPGGPQGAPVDGLQGRTFGSGPKGPRYPPRQEAPNGPNHTPPTWPNGPEARRPNDRNGSQDRWQRDSSKPQHAKLNSGINYGSTPRERGHFQGDTLGRPPNSSSRGPNPYREKYNGVTHTSQPPRPPQPPQPPQPSQPAQPAQPAQPYAAQGYAYPPEGYSQGYPPAHQAAAPVSVTQAQAQAQAYAVAYQAYASGYQAPSIAYYQQPAYPATTAYQGTHQPASGYPPAANPAYPGYDYGTAYTAPAYPAPVPAPGAAQPPAAAYSGYAQYR